MEIIRIGENKLKLILSDEDLDKYRLKFDGLDYDNTETRRVLWQILDEAKQKTGFDAAAERTLVQAYPGRRGGCEIYVTRLCQKAPSLRGRTSTYRFPDEESLFTVCHALMKSGRKYESALYRMGDGFYYLSLKEHLQNAIQKENLLSPLSFIEEYAERMSQSAFSSYIKEHGTCVIAEGAIELLEEFSSTERGTVLHKKEEAWEQ